MTNLIGAAWAGLVPVIVAIAVYFCIADGVLISQCLYYKYRNARHEAHRRRSSTPDPTTPLLGRRMSDNGGLSSSSINDGQQRRVSQPEDALAKIVEETESGRQAWTKNVLSVIAICGIGAAGWVIAWQTGAWTPAPQEHDGEKDMVAGAQVLGYASALCYLRWVDLSVHIPSSSGATYADRDNSARLPQIYKNYREKSCEGIYPRQRRHEDIRC